MSGKASDIKAGSAFVELFIKDEQLRAGLKNAQIALKSFGHTLQFIGGAMAAAGAAILAPLTAAVHTFTEFGSSLHDMSQRTGVSAQSLAELSHAAQQTGTDMEAVEKGLKFMAKNGMDPRRFDEVAARIAAIEDPTLRVQKAIATWGKAGTALLPMIGELKSLREEARALGLIVTDEQVKLADELGDAYDSIKTAVKAAAVQIGAALAPALIQVANFIKDVVVGIGSFAREFPIATQIVAAFGVALLVAGTALVTFGTIAAVVIPSVTALIAALDVVAAPWIALGIAIAIAVVELLAVEAVIVGIVGYFLLFTKTGRLLLDTALYPVYELLKRFEGMGSTIAKSFGLIVNALKAGDIKTAWKGLVLGMEAIWHGFLEGVFKSLADFVKAIVSLDPTGDIFGIGKGAENILRGLGAAQRDKRTMLENEMRALQISKPGGSQGKGGNPEDYMPELSAKSIGFSASAALRSRQVIGGSKDEKLLDTLTKMLTNSDQQLKETIEMKNKIPVRVK